MDRRAFSLLVAGLPFASAAAADAEQSRSKATGNAPVADVSTFTHVGKEEQPFIATPEATLADQDGSGYLDHMWFGGAFSKFTDLRIRIYVDGEVKPSIDMLLGASITPGSIQTA